MGESKERWERASYIRCHNTAQWQRKSFLGS